MAFSSWRTWVTGEVVTSAHMNQEVRDNGLALFPNEDLNVDWDPTLEATGSNPGVSAVNGARYRIGAIQFVWARFELSSAGSGVWTVALPVAASGVNASASSGAGQIIGSWHARDASITRTLGGGVLLQALDTVWFHSDEYTATGVNESAPVAWASGDVFSFHAQYPVA
jgi:hypothetical protein